MQIKYVLLQWCVSNWPHWNSRNYVAQMWKACEDFLSGYSIIRYLCIWAFAVCRESWASKYTEVPISFNAYLLKASKEELLVKTCLYYYRMKWFLQCVYKFIWNTSWSKVLQCYSLPLNYFFTWFLSPNMFEPNYNSVTYTH